MISGLADLPYEELEIKTPLMGARTPSLDALARCGCCGAIYTVPEEVPLTRENALLGVLGYDFRRGIPDPADLYKFGAARDSYEAPESLPYFVIPRFSGHGVVIARSLISHGIGKMALLKSVEADYSNPDISADRARVDLALKEITCMEFVLLDVECHVPKGQGAFEAKMRRIEEIDREVITPLADYVWNAKEQMNMVVVADVITSCRTGKIHDGEVPAVVYFNDDLPYETEKFDEESVLEGSLNAPLPGDLIHKLMTFEPLIDDNA